MRTTKGAVVLAAALLAAMLAVGVAWAAPGKTNDPTLGASAELRKAVEPAGILVHERNFARAARLSDPDEDGIGTRASGNEGVSPPSPEPSSTSGCEPEDFEPASEDEDQVALIQRGGCDFAVKAQNAEAAGYDAAIIFNEGQEDVPDDDRVGGVLGKLGEPGVDIPVIGISFELGADFYEDIQDDQEVRVSLDVETDNTDPVRETENIIADTPTGREGRTVVVGAHLDSVPEGPG